MNANTRQKGLQSLIDNNVNVFISLQDEVKAPKFPCVSAADLRSQSIAALFSNNPPTPIGSPALTTTLQIGGSTPPGGPSTSAGAAKGYLWPQKTYLHYQRCLLTLLKATLLLDHSCVDNHRIYHFYRLPIEDGETHSEDVITEYVAKILSLLLHKVNLGW